MAAVTDTKNVYQRLQAVQQELKAPKGQYNKFGNYAYRSAEDILEALKPLLAKHDLVLVVTDNIEMVGDRYYVKATAIVYGPNGAVEAHGYAREDETKKGMDGSQITGAASSYARKYALNGLFNIDDTKDADSDEHRNQSSNAPAAPKPARQEKGPYEPAPASTGSGATPKQLKYMATLFTQQGIEEREARHQMIEEIVGRKVASATELTKAEAKKVIDQLLPEGGEQ